MTAPRQILAGSSYLVTRRCAQRQLLLKPSRAVNWIFKYVLAVAAERYGVLVHAYCVLSNHFHLVVTDPRAHLPLFEQFLDSLVARALNAIYGRWENLWAPASYSAVRLETPDDIVDKVVYTLANPVAARLVEHGSDWPGLWSAPERMGGEAEVVERPDFFFKPDGTMPEKAHLRLVIPPAFKEAEEFRQRVVSTLDEGERTIARERKEKGWTFLGVGRVLAQKHTDRPGDAEPRRGLNPRVAAKDKWRRIEALGRLVSFLRDYREALAKLRSGVRDAVFPAGTYQLRVLYGVSCAGAG